ncbi:class-II fumarase/aspartase family protein [Actinokineospora globicatena]|uniref:class-II fumarase/aspartase family protein n=1 Tax=Actinokineospora globicatena TaxID=103729 RepID=UPI0020A343DD|nr:adenylosuccinate lyase family protein [Actinokineospora globicatena]MCP2306531.1 3-carboxy-cis,cis-muconate cycloisomerase [Actinokineospora globicatena]GLW81962.1 putative 3-carboxymuconate cycloisomerase [Actinokineospora globicatena]GLW88756.1 putative 3-carboxymuconate cycloisomerase [Actinokineospora globicatena]
MTGTDSGLLAPVWAGAEAADLVTDEAWVAAMVEVEVALARAQATFGVIPEAAADAIAGAVADIDVVDLAVRSRGGANPIVAFVTAFTACVPEDAREYVHRGSTSQDILDTAAMLITRRVFAVVQRDLLRVAEALARLADEHRGTVMAGRTLTQHAVPVTFGLKAAGWLSSVLDGLDRVRAVVLPAQLGGAAGTLASYVEYAGDPGHGVVLSAEFASVLGLPEAVVPWHALRTPFVDIGSAATVVTGALGKFALDVQGMSRTEVGEVVEPSAEGRGVSSAMPQKRNPVLATLVMAAARQVPLYATVLAQSMIAEDERAPGAWHAEWQPLRELLRCLGGAAATAAELAEGLEVFPARLRENLALTGGTIVSERLNVALAPVLGKVEAKKLLARLSRSADFSAALRAAPELASVDVDALLDPAAYLGATDALIDRALARPRT